MTPSVFVIMLILPQFLKAKISVEIDCARESSEEIRVKLSGETEKDIITDLELATYQLNDTERLKDAIKRYADTNPDPSLFNGDVPPGIGVISQFTEGHGPPPVSKVVKPKRASDMTLYCESSIPSPYFIDLIPNIKPHKRREIFVKIAKDTLENKSSTWDLADKVSVNDEIEYTFNNVNLYPKKKAPKKLNCTSKWGDLTPASIKRTLGLQCDLPISFEPHQSIFVLMVVEKCTLKVQVEYEISLTGTVMYELEPNIKWVDIPTLLKFAGLNSTYTVKEVIQYDYYIEPIVELFTYVNATAQTLYNFPVNVF